MTDVQDRFWAKVDQGPGLGPDGECWEWRAATGAGGYGVFKVQPGRTRTAHRWSLVMETGEDPIGLVVRHSCDNPLCVKPAHLEWGTRAENEGDKYRNLARQRS